MLAKNLMQNPIEMLLAAHGLRHTEDARIILRWLSARPKTSYTQAQLQSALESDIENGTLASVDRVTLYRLIDRLTQLGLLLCQVNASRVRRYQAIPASIHAISYFECQSCHSDQPLSRELIANADDIEVATQIALKSLKALGYQGLSMDFEVRGVCADCSAAT